LTFWRSAFLFHPFELDRLLFICTFLASLFILAQPSTQAQMSQNNIADSLIEDSSSLADLLVPRKTIGFKSPSKLFVRILQSSSQLNCTPTLPSPVCPPANFNSNTLVPTRSLTPSLTPSLSSQSLPDATILSQNSVGNFDDCLSQDVPASPNSSRPAKRPRISATPTPPPLTPRPHMSLVAMPLFLRTIRTETRIAFGGNAQAGNQVDSAAIEKNLTSVVTCSAVTNALFQPYESTIFSSNLAAVVSRCLSHYACDEVKRVPNAIRSAYAALQLGHCPFFSIEHSHWGTLFFFRSAFAKTYIEHATRPQKEGSSTRDREQSMMQDGVVSCAFVRESALFADAAEDDICCLWMSCPRSLSADLQQKELPFTVHNSSSGARSGAFDADVMLRSNEVLQRFVEYVCTRFSESVDEVLRNSQRVSMIVRSPEPFVGATQQAASFGPIRVGSVGKIHLTIQGDMMGIHVGILVDCIRRSLPTWGDFSVYGSSGFRKLQVGQRSITLG
jgi:hypothetical protein